jgi:hypothetical protein
MTRRIEAWLRDTPDGEERRENSYLDSLVPHENSRFGRINPSESKLFLFGFVLADGLGLAWPPSRTRPRARFLGINFFEIFVADTQNPW